MKILTANRLTDGAVVYLTASGDWSHDLSHALRLTDADAPAALAAAELLPRVLVGPYLIDADERGPAGRERLKETIRAAGPTVGHSLREPA
jgi:hypothetical protein